MSFGVRVWIVIVVLVCLRGVAVWLEVAVSQALPRSEEDSWNSGLTFGVFSLSGNSLGFLNYKLSSLNFSSSSSLNRLARTGLRTIQPSRSFTKTEHRCLPHQISTAPTVITGQGK